MIVICKKCSSYNKIDDQENINNYYCGNCKHKSLVLYKHYKFPSTSTIVISVAIGSFLGFIMVGPIGAIVGVLVGLFIAMATWYQI